MISTVFSSSSFSQLLEKSFEVYKDRPCFGRRKRNLNEILNEFEWISYGDAFKRCKDFGCGLKHLLSNQVMKNFSFLKFIYFFFLISIKESKMFSWIM